MKQKYESSAEMKLERERDLEDIAFESWLKISMLLSLNFNSCKDEHRSSISGAW